jgi:hypothetical protein
MDSDETVSEWIGYFRGRLIRSGWSIPDMHKAMIHDELNEVLTISNGRRTFKYWYHEDAFGLSPYCRRKTESPDILWLIGSPLATAIGQLPFIDVKYVVLSPQLLDPWIITSIQDKFPKAELIFCGYTSESCAWRGSFTAPRGAGDRPRPGVIIHPVAK